MKEKASWASKGIEGKAQTVPDGDGKLMNRTRKL